MGIKRGGKDRRLTAVEIDSQIHGATLKVQHLEYIGNARRLKLKFISVEEKASERDASRNIAQTSGYGKDRPFGRSFLSAAVRIGSLAVHMAAFSCA